MPSVKGKKIERRNLGRCTCLKVSVQQRALDCCSAVMGWLVVLVASLSKQLSAHKAVMKGTRLNRKTKRNTEKKEIHSKQIRLQDKHCPVVLVHLGGKGRWGGSVSSNPALFIE